MAITQNHRMLKKAFPDKEIESSEIYFIDGRIYVGSIFLERSYGISQRQITNWEAKGLQRSELSQAKLKLYDLKYVEEWREENISKKHSKSTDSRKGVIVRPDGSKDESQLPIEEVSVQEVERRHAVWKAKNEEIKLKEAMGELIKAEELDVAMAEQAAIHVAQYQNDLKLLPIMLENKDKSEIKEYLDGHYEDRITSLNKLVHRVMDVPETVYDALLELVKNINFGLKMSIIMEKLRGMRGLEDETGKPKRKNVQSPVAVLPRVKKTKT